MGLWGEHIYKISEIENFDCKNPDNEISKLKKMIEPWLAAIFQSEHLSLLLGSGFTTAIAFQSGVSSANMECNYNVFPEKYRKLIESTANKTSKLMGRGKANIEDQIRVANSLIQGLKILEHEDCEKIIDSLDEIFKAFLFGILKTEQDIYSSVKNKSFIYTNDLNDIDNDKVDPLNMLVSFLMSFSCRISTRERLHIFTTNYDRLIEFGADLAGLHVIDRFVGCLEPIFRSSRLDIDLHYNPPGIRGEPRYLEGVIRLTKLHGSLDWIYQNGLVKKIGLPFGVQIDHLSFNNKPSESVMIYPNPAKDRETAEYPYVELFRDYAAAICRPNSALVTYGYGFGDDHINRVIADMLTIPSTHLVIISYSDEGSRISSFCKKVGHDAQISLLIGMHFGSMPILVENYLPKPAIDRITFCQTELLKNRGWDSSSSKKQNDEDINSE